MSNLHPFEEMLSKIASAVQYDTAGSSDLALAVAAKLSLAVANVAGGKLLDRSSQRMIRDFQEACLQRVFMNAIAESFQNKDLLAKVQAIITVAVEKNAVEKTKTE